MVEPRYDASLDFLRRWTSTGLWVLTAVHPTTKAIETASFDATTEAREARSWVERLGKTSNVYYHVNPVRHRLASKASKEDIAALAWLHVDADPRAGEDLTSEQDRLRALFLGEPPKGVPPPSLVVFSGGGYQAFWHLREPVLLSGPADIVKAEAYNRQLELDYGGDHCYNVDRIMRLPGTVNRPDARKRAKGRVEALAEVVRWGEEAYDLTSFVPAVLTQDRMGGFSSGSNAPKVVVSGNVKRLASLDELGARVSDRTKAIILHGKDPLEPGRYGSRSEALWYVVCQLVRDGVEDETIFSIITDPNFAISGHVLDTNHASRYALRQIARAKENAVHPALCELNEKHALVEDIGGKCRIISETTDGLANGRTRLSFQSADDFRLRYSNRTVQIETADGPVGVPLGNWWLKHPMRRQYSSIVFVPEAEDTNGSYNLWKGFAYAAKPGGSCDRYLDHLAENICSGNENYLRYLLGWMASVVQNPASPGHVAVVLRGAQGTGKGVFAKTFGRLFGRHFLQVSDPKHLVGSFNAHLRDTVLLFADEAFYAGDRKHESVLKMLVTEETLTIEAKGVDAVAAPNYVHLIMASNDEWVVPAGAHERRFFVLDISESRRQDSAYFASIQAELDAGGYEALLYLLRTLDLSTFSVRDYPRTEGLTEQKMLSLRPEQDWWFQKLLAGEALTGLGWPGTVFVEEFHDDFTRHVRSFSLSSRGGATRFGIFLKKMCPLGWTLRIALDGTYDVRDSTGRVRSVKNPQVYRLPPLGECREIWDAATGAKRQWADMPRAEEGTSF